MSIETVKKIESQFCDKTGSYSIQNWIDVFLNLKSSNLLYFIRKCSEQFLAYQDDTHSSIMHGLVKSQLSSSDKMKSLKLLLTRDVNCNKPDSAGKYVLDYLVEDDECECIEVLLQYDHNLEISDKCLSRAFQLHNTQENVFKLLFAYAIKHNIAPHLTGVSDGDTFLHDIMLIEKEKMQFKKWMGFFLSFSKIKIDAVNSNGLTIFDLLLLNYKKERFKCAIKLVIKYRFPNISVDDCSELQLFPLNKMTKSHQFKNEILRYCKKGFKNVSSTDSKISIISNGSSFSHKYIRCLEQCLFTKSSKKSLPNDSGISIKLPNSEESEMLFEKVFDTKKPSVVSQEKKTKSQKSITKTAKAKNYLSTTEAVLYHKLIRGKGSNTLHSCTQTISKSNDSVYKQEEGKNSGYKEDLKSNLPKAVQSFIVEIQKRPFALPSELMKYFHLHSLVHYMIISAAKLYKSNLDIEITTNSRIKYSRLVLCVNKSCLTQDEIEMQESTEETMVCIKAFALPAKLNKWLNVLQYSEEGILKKTVKKAAVKFESSVICLKCFPERLKTLKIGTEVKKASFSVSLDTKYCACYSFTNLLQFINKKICFKQKLYFFTLHKTAITPIIQCFNDLNVKGLNQCIIIPNSVMHLVPFSALLDSHTKEYFGDQLAAPSILFLESINWNKACNKSIKVPFGKKDSFLIVDNSAFLLFKHNSTPKALELLPDVEREARSIANVLKTVPVLREQATVNQRSGYLAFSYMPKFSVTDQKWKLFPNEIKALEISPDLVILSCCGSKKSQIEMVCAFIEAGAQCVISSFCKVDNKNPSIFMQFLYQLLSNAGLAKIPSNIAIVNSTTGRLSIFPDTELTGVNIARMHLIVSKQRKISNSASKKILLPPLTMNERIFEDLAKFQIISKTTKNDVPETVQCFIVEIQKRLFALPSELMKYFHMRSLVHYMITSAAKLHKNNLSIEFSTNDETAMEATKTGIEYSQLVFCANKPCLTQDVSQIVAQEAKIETQESTEETMVYKDTFALPAEIDFSQFLEGDTRENEKTVEKAVVKFESPVICLKCFPEGLKGWVFAKIGTEVKKASFFVPIDTNYCAGYSFTELLKNGLQQSINEENYSKQKLYFTTLHETIIPPIIQCFNDLNIKGLNQCIIIPKGVMRLVPFYALFDGNNGEYFGDKYELTIIPSISFLENMKWNKARNKTVRVPGKRNSFLIVGNPLFSTLKALELPDAEIEARSIASVLQTDPVLRKQATKDVVLPKMRLAKIIHLATHGGSDYLALSRRSEYDGTDQGWKLFPYEIEALELSADLVVLSCCGSEKSQIEMADAFIEAGAKCVILSCSKVDDKNTSIFMQLFYLLLSNGIPSPQAFQRTMQFARCLSELPDFVNWGGFLHFGMTIKLHKSTSDQFPIEKLLGEASLFPRPVVYDVEDSLQAAASFSDVQLLVGTPGDEPEECARDFIKKCYYYYPCGVYWYDASNKLLLETSMKVAHETLLRGGRYKKYKDFGVLPVISNPLSSLTSENNKSTFNRGGKKLIILHNFTTLETCSCIMEEMEDASTDVIIVSNELFCKEEMVAEYFKKHFSRGCNVIKVTNLKPIHIMQRILYGLLEKDSFVAKGDDHDVFKQLCEYSQGEATMVHMLTSLMQKCDDNRKSFELVKQHLKRIAAVVHQGSVISQGSEESSDSQSINQQMQRPIPLCLVVKEMLKHLLSAKAYYLLEHLSIFGPIPLPMFYVTELDNLIVNEQHMLCQPEFESNGIVRKYPYPLVYHKDLRPKYVNFNAQLVFIPKRISDAVKSEINHDSVYKILCTHDDLIKRIKAQNSYSPYIHVLCSQLQNFCKENGLNYGTWIWD